jgi:putative NADH-flavin reductase
MKVALIGATGRIGSRILAEALARGHSITGISRHPETLPKHERVVGRGIDLHDVDALTAALRGHDAVIYSYGPGFDFISAPDVFDMYVNAHKALLAAVKASGVKRLLCVGGAASLKTPADVELLNSPDWPPVFKKEGPRGLRELKVMLGKEPDLDWVFLSPSIIIEPGERTGAYRLGKDHILYGPDGKSRITMEDYAVAMVDELERSAHHRERFTVGY